MCAEVLFSEAYGGSVQFATLQSQVTCATMPGATNRICAGVVELADTEDLKSSGLRPVRVQIPPSAPF